MENATPQLYDGSRGPTTNRLRQDISTMEGIKFWANVNSCGRSTTLAFVEINIYL